MARRKGGKRKIEGYEHSDKQRLNNPPVGLVTPDTDKDEGKKTYLVCSKCHGVDGLGIWSSNAPRQAGISDWYLVNQLKNFRNNVRGSHPQDYNGSQMALMSKFLFNDEAINDLVAYINTLR